MHLPPVLIQPGGRKSVHNALRNNKKARSERVEQHLEGEREARGAIRYEWTLGCADSLSALLRSDAMGRKGPLAVTHIEYYFGLLA